MPEREIATQSAFAALCGVNKSQVTRWIERGLIQGNAIVGSGRARRIDVALARKQLASHRDPGQAISNGARTKLRGAPPSTRINDDQADEGNDPTDPDFAREKAGLVRAQREAQEMKNALTRGEQVSVAAVEQKWDEIRATVLAALLAVPGRVRQAHPDLAPAHYQAFDAELRLALSKLAARGTP